MSLRQMLNPPRTDPEVQRAMKKVFEFIAYEAIKNHKILKTTLDGGAKTKEKIDELVKLTDKHLNGSLNNLVDKGFLDYYKHVKEYRITSKGYEYYYFLNDLLIENSFKQTWV